MAAWSPVLRRVLPSGSSAASTLALATVARLEGRGALPPVDVTGHCSIGRAAASVRRADLRHAVAGTWTRYAAALFRAALFERLIARRSPIEPLPTPGRALAVSDRRIQRFYRTGCQRP